VILMALGLMPKLGALVAVMPPAVLGGATVVLFGLVAMAGVRIVAQGGFSGRTMFILAVACGLGLGVQTFQGRSRNSPSRGTRSSARRSS
jgi:xanthine/uracil permease